MFDARTVAFGVVSSSQRVLEMRLKIAANLRHQRSNSCAKMQILLAVALDWE
jgi:hypothetical protein